MICPKRKELGQKSTIVGGNMFSTAAYYQPYYDEDGKYHFHDGNNHTREYTCSKGHKIIVNLSNKCGACSYGHEEKITVSDLPLPFGTLTLNKDGSIVSLGTVTFKTGESCE
jgi:hypothetical protein